MTTEESQDHTGEDDCPPPRDRDPNCDPQLIDDVTCTVQGTKASADYDAVYEPLLEQAKKDYDTTRKDYRAKRHEAALQVQDMRHQVKHLIERVKCLIEQKRVWRCLDDAFCEILKELKCCETKVGCCARECVFKVDDVETLGLPDLLKRITAYQRMTDEAKDCFIKLLEEPDALVKRVAAAKAKIDEINKALSADAAKIDLKRVYAVALVANHDIEEIWGGFNDAHDFVDCLCRALTCWTKGCAAVSVLTGARAVKECKQKAEQDHCDDLKTNTADEILAMYDKLCPNDRPCEDRADPGPDPDPHSGDEDDCDECGHHHHKNGGDPKHGSGQP